MIDEDRLTLPRSSVSSSSWLCGLLLSRMISITLFPPPLFFFFLIKILYSRQYNLLFVNPRMWKIVKPFIYSNFYISFLPFSSEELFCFSKIFFFLTIFRKYLSVCLYVCMSPKFCDSKCLITLKLMTEMLCKFLFR